jgi:hypothetical protein
MPKTTNRLHHCKVQTALRTTSPSRNCDSVPKEIAIKETYLPRGEEGERKEQVETAS